MHELGRGPAHPLSDARGEDHVRQPRRAQVRQSAGHAAAFSARRHPGEVVIRSALPRPAVPRASCTHEYSDRVQTLATSRLDLRPWKRDDADFAFDLYSRWDVQQFIGRTPRVMT